MIRLLSYIFPITKKVESEYNGTLEITWHNGEKHLDTKNANYSYGSLQKILKTGLENIDLTNCRKILILGLGGGSVIETLINDFKYKNHITALDIDSVIIDIAKKEFNLLESENLKIICDDASTFMNKNKEIFDLIIIDLFIDTIVPSPFYKTSFWEQIIKANSSNGYILFNASVQPIDNNNLSEITFFLSNHNYATEEFNKVNGTNTLLISRSIK
ncbi:MAG: methyltransferase domain-containing protein [Aureibaculum sp.]